MRRQHRDTCIKRTPTCTYSNVTQVHSLPCPARAPLAQWKCACTLSNRCCVALCDIIIFLCPVQSVSQVNNSAGLKRSENLRTCSGREPLHTCQYPPLSVSGVHRGAFLHKHVEQGRCLSNSPICQMTTVWVKQFSNIVDVSVQRGTISLGTIDIFITNR